MTVHRVEKIESPEALKLREEMKHAPDRKKIARLEQRLLRAFQETQAIVHIETGALKASGRVHSSVDRATHVWQGEITYGDAGTPAEAYAAYEAARGGPHDFFAPLERYPDIFGEELEVD